MTRIVLCGLVVLSGIFAIVMICLAPDARALTDGTETVCQPRTWSDCQTAERFTPAHTPVLKITDRIGGRLYG